MLSCSAAVPSRASTTPSGSPWSGRSTTPTSWRCTRTATAARVYGRPSDVWAGGGGGSPPPPPAPREARPPASTSTRQTGPAERLVIVAEPQDALDGGAHAAIDRGDRQRLGDVLGVLVRTGAGRLLELRQRARVAGLAHVVGPAAVGAGVLDGEAVQQVVRAAAARQLDVHGAAGVVRVLALQDDDGRGGAPLDGGDPQAGTDE